MKFKMLHAAVDLFSLMYSILCLTYHSIVDGYLRSQFEDMIVKGIAVSIISLSKIICTHFCIYLIK